MRGKMIKEPVAQYIVDAKGKRTAVIMDIETYEGILELLDELSCAKAYDNAVEGVRREIAHGEVTTLEELLRSRKTKPRKKSTTRLR